MWEASPFALLLLILGLVLKDQASFAKDYVKDQLSEQKIFFTPAENLSDEEKQSECLVDNGQGDEANRQMVTGKQAECYANDYIALHLSEATGGLTYAELGTPQRELREQVAAATESNDPALEDLQGQLDAVNGQRDTAFRGETLRGLLLTSYGFSIFGDRADLAGMVCMIGALLLVVLSLAGLAHAFMTPKDKKVLTT